MQMVEDTNRVVSLQKDQHKESLDCLCKLLQTFGKDLDTGDAKVTQRGWGGGCSMENTVIQHLKSESLSSTCRCRQRSQDDIAVVLLHVWELGFVSAAVLQSFFQVLLDEGIITKEVFHKWESTAAQQGKDDSNSVAGFFTRLHEPEDRHAVSTLCCEEYSVGSEDSRTPTELPHQPFKQRPHSV